MLRYLAQHVGDSDAVLEGIKLDAACRRPRSSDVSRKRRLADTTVPIEERGSSLAPLAVFAVIDVAGVLSRLLCKLDCRYWMQSTALRTGPRNSAPAPRRSCARVKAEELDSLLNSKLAARLCRSGHGFNCGASARSADMAAPDLPILFAPDLPCRFTGLFTGTVDGSAGRMRKPRRALAIVR